jgi:outer membrane immunogenic protein
MEMRDFTLRLLTTVSTLVLVGSANAADLPVKAPPAAPPPALLWTGPYIGLDVGGYFHRTESIDQTVGLIPGFSGSLTADNVFVGGHVGYNWQWSMFVLGAEADISSPGSSSSTRYGPPGFGNPETLTTEIKWLSTVRGRAGVTFSNVLLYATGGVAFARISNTRADPTTLGFTLNDDSTRTAGVVGGGVEYKFDRNWSARVEGLWMKFPDKTFNTIGFNNPALAYQTRFTNSVGIIRGGVSLSW